MPKAKLELNWCTELDTSSWSKSAFVSAEILPSIVSCCDCRIFVPNLRNVSVPKEIAAQAQVLDIREFTNSRSAAPSVLCLEDLASNIPLRNVLAEVSDTTLWLHDVHEREQSSSPALLELAATSSRRLFTSMRNLEEFRSLCPGAKGESWLLPYPIRSREAVARATSTIVCCGRPLVEDHVHLILQAMSNVRSEMILQWLVRPEDETSARALISRFPNVQVEIRSACGFSAWEAVLQSAALAFHLHFSSFGDLGPELNLSLELGVPVAVLDFGDGEQLPRETALKIETGELEVVQLERIIQDFLSEKEFAAGLRALGERGKLFAESHFQAEFLASQLLGLVFSGVASSNRSVPVFGADRI